MLSKEEKSRYSRHTMLQEIGVEGQLKLKNSSVLVVGAGGLGCPVLMYLAAAGVGRIGIVDADTVDESNLQRQVLYTNDDVGEFKAIAAKKRLVAQNSLIEVEAYTSNFVRENAEEIGKSYAIIVDGTDNFPTRYLINDYCVLNNKSNVHGSILKFSGQVSVFNGLLEDGSRGPNYRDIYPNPPKPEDVQTCSDVGVVGALTGIIGSMQAIEVVKLITGIGNPLIGKILGYDSLSHSTQTIKFEKDDENPISGTHPTIKELIDYDQFCGLKAENKSMKSVTVQELKAMQDANEDFQLIDVREPHENEICTLNALLIPMGEIQERFAEITKDKKVVVHCRSGARSGNVIQFLEQQHGYDNLYNLQGGILAWATEIDTSLEAY